MNNKLKIFVVPVLALSTVSLVGCGEKSNGLDDAAAYLKELYKVDETVSTTADYQVVSKIIVEENTFNITWTANIAEGGLAEAVKVGSSDGTYTNIEVKYDSVYNASVRTDYQLVATLANDKGKTTTVTFNRYVPQFVYTSLVDFLAAADDTEVNVKGRVIMRSTYNSKYDTFKVWIQNDEGGYYGLLPCEGDKKEEKYNSELAIGNEIVVSGKKKVSYGMLEISDPTYQVVSTTPADVAYVDATAAFTNASSNKDTASLNKYQNMKVELKDVEVTGVTDNSKGNYYNFKLGNNVYYTRGSKSYGLTDADLTAMFDNWVPGYKATVRGVVNVYSNAFYLQPLSADDVKFTSTTLSDDAKVNGALAELSDLFASSYVEAKEVALPTNPTTEAYADVNFAWALNAESDTTCFAISDNKLVISVPSTPGSSVTGKVDVTASVGGASKTETYTMTVTNPAKVDSYTYSFAGKSENKGTGLKDDTAKTLFDLAFAGDAGTSPLSSVTVTSVYDGNGSGGAYPNTAGLLKFGTGSVNGELTLTFAESIKISKVVVNCHDWYKTNDNNPTNSNQLSVNDSDPQLVPYNAEGTPGDLTFEIAASNVVKLSSSNTGSTESKTVGGRIFVFSITLYVAE